jgi:hypothetical protein
MSIAQDPELAVVTRASDCTAILQPGVNMLWWRRGEVPAAIDRSYRVWLPEPDAIEALRPHVASVLFDDIALLVSLYFKLAKPQAVNAKLEVVQSRQCPLLHVDAVGLRLICTYTGTGTQWVANSDIQRHELGWKNDVGHEAANARMMKPGATLMQANPGDVLILKGEVWPGNEGNGVVHVSPPLRQSESRIRLVIDAA